MGVRKTITRISKFSYFPLMDMICRGKVLSAKYIKGEQAEVMEALALETSDIVGKPLKTYRFPKELW
jgi:trk system potassium uptake protein